jgi:tetratricopeptide (TPR) repeat protein
MDLRLVLARTHLARHKPQEAFRWADEALTRAADPTCGYAWGEADAAHLAGLALRDLGRRAEALARFERAAALRARIEYPGVAESRSEVAALAK